MSTYRRNTIIRSIAAVCGDITVGLAVASACTWIIQSAALGLFLSFLVWLTGTLIALAFSQYIIHPVIHALLSERKLDQALDAVASLADVAHGAGVQAAGGLGRCMNSAFSAGTARFRAV